MKRLIFSAMLAVVFLMAAAQTIQHGVVLEYLGPNPKNPLPGVEISVAPNINAVSDSAGLFTLAFPTMNPGDRINVRSITKEGYELFNKDAVEQWTFEPADTFRIVMCNSELFRHLKDSFKQDALEHYNRQYDEDKAALSQRRAVNSMEEQEYNDSLRILESIYARRLESLDGYIDRLARIDFSSMTLEEQRIICFMSDGKIEEAIAAYEDFSRRKKLQESINQRNEIATCLACLEEVGNSLSASLDSMRNMVETQIATLLLADDSNNNAKIMELYRTVADADTTDVEWLLKTSEFAADSIRDYNQALRYTTTALNNVLSRENPDYGLLSNCYDSLSKVYTLKGEETKSEEYKKKAILAALREHCNENPADVGPLMFLTVGYLTEEQFADAKDCSARLYQTLEANPGRDPNALEKAYGMYLLSLTKLAETDSTANAEISRFMADKIWAGDKPREGTPAYEKGISQGFVILEFAEWNFMSDKGLYEVTHRYQGQPKSLVIMQGDNIDRYDFEDNLGMNFEMRKVTPEEKARVVEAYRRWKENNENNQ